MSRRLSNWGSRHGHALVSTLGHLTRHPIASLLTLLAIAVALALPLALGVLLQDLSELRGNLGDALGVSVYLKPQTSQTRLQQLAVQLRRRLGIANVRVVTAEEGLALLRQQSGLGAALTILTDNPLPAVLEVHPSLSAASTLQLERLRSDLAALPDVDQVQLDRDWAVRFAAILALLQELGRVLAVLLAAGVVAVIGNTVRLEIQARAAEIEVLKLVGGSNAFVRRPFLYAGVLYGGLAALLAWSMVALSGLALQRSAAQLASAYGSAFLLQGPGWQALGMVVAAGAILGWVGAGLAAWRQLAQLKPIA